MDDTAPDPVMINDAVRALRRGELVVFPTETVYGLAADPGQPDAVGKLYEAKGRDFNKPVAFFISDLSQISQMDVIMTDAASALAAEYWPGPLTLVLPNEKGAFLGFRMPDHPIPMAVLRAFGATLAVTSANRSGEPEALTAADAERSLGGWVHCLIDGGRVQGSIPSTVVRVDADNQVTVLREGALTKEQVFETVNR